MRTLNRRISRLEERFASRLDEERPSPAEVIRERRRRRLAAEGREPEKDPLWKNVIDTGSRPRSIADVIRSARFRRRPRPERRPMQNLRHL
jgi:hypothetical protein